MLITISPCTCKSNVFPLNVTWYDIVTFYQNNIDHVESRGLESGGKVSISVAERVVLYRPQLRGRREVMPPKA